MFLFVFHFIRYWVTCTIYLLTYLLYTCNFMYTCIIHTQCLALYLSIREFDRVFTQQELLSSRHYPGKVFSVVSGKAENNSEERSLVDMAVCLHDSGQHLSEEVETHVLLH